MRVLLVLPLVSWSDPRVDVARHAQAHVRGQPKLGRHKLSLERPSKPAVVRREGKGEALALVVAGYTVVEKLVVPDLGAHGPARIERRVLAQLGVKAGDPLGRGRHELGKAERPHGRARMRVPQALLVDLGSETGGRGGEPPNRASLSDEVSLVNLRVARNLGVAKRRQQGGDKKQHQEHNAGEHGVLHD